MYKGSSSISKVMGAPAKLREPKFGEEATEYVAQHYQELVRFAIYNCKVHPQDANDLVNDVYISLVHSELKDRGFDDDITPDVACYVYGRLSLYSKNIKYHSKLMEHDIKEMPVDPTGAIEDVGDDTGRYAGMFKLFQAAFTMAEDYDEEPEILEEIMSLRSNIELCVDIGENVGIDVLDMMRALAMGAKFENLSKNVFSGLAAAAKYHDEFGEALLSVLSCAQYECFRRELAAFS